MQLNLHQLPWQNPTGSGSASTACKLDPDLTSGGEAADPDKAVYRLEGSTYLRLVFRGLFGAA